MKKQLSIILPVYNVENYIRPCFESIFKQGLDETIFEVIIVNDGSTDKSIEMISDIISQHHNVVIINQDNQGLSVARNNGINIATGEYILMPDSDDLLVENSLALLLKMALEKKADLIVADFLKIDANSNSAILPIPPKENMALEKTGAGLLLDDLNPNECYVWRTLYRRMFLIDNDISFMPGVRFQDIPFTHECYLKAKNCVRVNKVFYYYRVGRAGAATESFNMEKASEFCSVIARTWKLTHLDGLTPDVGKKLKDDVYTSFSRFIYLSIYAVKDKKYSVVLLKRLKKEVPDMVFTNGFKQRIISFLYRHCPSIYLDILKLKSIVGKGL